MLYLMPFLYNRTKYIPTTHTTLRFYSDDVALPSRFFYLLYIFIYHFLLFVMAYTVNKIDLTVFIVIHTNNDTLCSYMLLHFQ